MGYTSINSNYNEHSEILEALVSLPSRAKSMKHLEILSGYRATWIRVFTVLTITLFFALTNHEIAKSQPSSQPPSLLFVRLDSTGQLYIDRKPVTQGQLRQAVKRFAQENPCGLAILSASSTAKYNSVLGVIDVFREVAVQRIALSFPTYVKDGVFTPISSIVEINQVSPPTIGSLGSLTPSNCSKQPFELPQAPSTYKLPQVPSLIHLPRLDKPFPLPQAPPRSLPSR